MTSIAPILRAERGEAIAAAMDEWFEPEWVGPFLGVFVPALFYFVLILTYRTARRFAWVALILLIVLFIGSYRISGYFKVLAEIASAASTLSLAQIVAFLAAWLLARPLLWILRRLGARRREELEPPPRPGLLMHQRPSVATRAIAMLLIAALLSIPASSAFAAAAPEHPVAPHQAWSPLLSMNQIVLDRELRPVCHCGMPVSGEDLPRQLKNALVAIEDRRFHIHRGIDPIGMLRAARAFLLGGKLQGGSTLSQQLAKFTLLSEERTLLRKGQDLIWGVRIDAALTKEDIILLYLNRAVFGWSRGRPIVGAEQASRFFFGKRARDLNLYEAAALAGLVNAPIRLDPKRNPKRLAARARLVLRKMREEGYVTRKDVVAALRAGVRRGDLKPLRIEPRYFAEWAMTELAAIEPAIERRPGLRLFVSLDWQSQVNAERAIGKALDRHASQLAGEGALLAIDRRGRVRAMVGGRDFTASQFNRAVKARRQPASAFKPFVYLTALEQGMRPQTRILDVAPERFAASGKIAGPFHGLLTFEQALAVSANGAAVRLADKVGLANVVATARRLGIKSPLRADRSLALGASEVSLIELTSAFAPFANGGLEARPQGIVAVVDSGRLRHVAERGPPKEVTGKATAAAMRRMLRSVVAAGTGRGANIGSDAAGKTGTSQDNRDALFVGFAGDVVAGLWLGNDDHSPMRGVTGSEAALAWANFMANELAR